MIDLEQIRRNIIASEGRVPHAYEDTEGYLTIGVGHLIDKRRGGRLPDHIIDRLLDYDISECTKALDYGIPWWRDLPWEVGEALVEMCFQLGWPGLSKFKKMLGHMEAGSFREAAAEALDSRWAQQTPERAQKLAVEIAKGDK